MGSCGCIYWLCGRLDCESGSFVDKQTIQNFEFQQKMTQINKIQASYELANSQQKMIRLQESNKKVADMVRRFKRKAISEAARRRLPNQNSSLKAINKSGQKLNRIQIPFAAGFDSLTSREAFW